MSNAENRSSPGAAGRLSFPEDEARFDWLPMLLDACATVDEGVAEGIRRAQAQGKTLACARGCAACCRAHRDIPVYPLELVGLSWYVTEKLQGPVRQRLKQQLRVHAKGEPCPFLVDEVCSVHPLRPLACRQFNVFGKVCAEGEDAWHTRREDVMTPIKKYTDEAFFTMLPFYGVKKSAERRRVIKDGAQHQLAKVLQDFDWSSLADKMEAWEQGHPDIADPDKRG